MWSAFLLCLAIACVPFASGPKAGFLSLLMVCALFALAIATPEPVRQ